MSASSETSKVKKQVSFTTDCKSHDGMTERNANLDTIIKHFFFHRIDVTERHVVSVTKTPLAAFHLYHDLLMLSHRVAALQPLSPQAWIPALPFGGGKCAKLFYSHLTLVQHLVKITEQVSKKLYRKQHSRGERSITIGGGGVSLGRRDYIAGGSSSSSNGQIGERRLMFRGNDGGVCGSLKPASVLL